MESTKPAKRSVRRKKARGLLVVAASFALGTMMSSGCDDGGGGGGGGDGGSGSPSGEPDMSTIFISNDMNPRDLAKPVD